MSSVIPTNDNEQTIIDRMLSECSFLDDYTFCSQYPEFKKLEDLFKKLDIQFLTKLGTENTIELHIYVNSQSEPIQINIKDNLNEFIDTLESLSKNPRAVTRHYVYVRMELEILKSLSDIDWLPFRRETTEEFCENMPQHRSIAIVTTNDNHIIPDDYLLGMYENFMFVKLDDYISNINILNNTPLTPAISKSMKLLYEIIKISKLEGYVETLSNTTYKS